MPDSENSETTSIGEAFPPGLPVIYVKFILHIWQFRFQREDQGPQLLNPSPHWPTPHPSLTPPPSTPSPRHKPSPAHPAAADWMVEFGPKTHHTVCLQLFDVVLFTNHEHIWVTQHVSQRLLPAQTDGDVNQALSASLCRWSHRRQRASGPCVLADGCRLPCVP